jgi:hypothetical protein
MAHDGPERGRTTVHTELHLARGIVEGRILRGQDAAQTRDLNLAIAAARRARRTARRAR